MNIGDKNTLIMEELTSMCSNISIDLDQRRSQNPEVTQYERRYSIYSIDNPNWPKKTDIVNQDATIAITSNRRNGHWLGTLWPSKDLVFFFVKA